MYSSSSPRTGRHHYFSRDRASVKKPFARATSLDKVVGIFEKFRKNKGGHGHHALGSPREGSVFALVQRCSLLSPKRCRKHMNTSRR
jgi:hypothetical protein